MPFNFSLDARVLEWQARIRAFIRDDRDTARAARIRRRRRRRPAPRAAGGGQGGRHLGPAAARPTSAAADSASTTSRCCSKRPAPRCSARSRSTPRPPTRATCTCSTMIATPAQRARYLEPLAAGDIRSAFAMTEPAAGRRLGPVRPADHGHQGGRRLAHRRPQAPDQRGRRGGLLHRDGGRRRSADGSGATMLLVDADAPGLHVGEHLHTIDVGFIGGHCHVDFDGVTVG